MEKINGATTGAITLSTTNTALSGTAANLEAAFAGTITEHTGTVTVTDAPSVTELKAINAGSTGAITLNVTNGALSGTSSDLVLAFAGTVTEHTGTVGITNADYTVDQLKTINNASTGAITFTTATTALSGTSSDLAIALAGTTNHNGTVTITNSDYTVAELKVINTGTSGTLSFTTPGTALSASASDLTTALAGTTNYSGNLTVTGGATVAQQTTLASDTSGTLTYALSDSGPNVGAASSSIVNGATSITINDQAGDTGNIVDLGNVTSTSSLTGSFPVSITGDGRIDQVELSTVLSESGKVTMDLVSDSNDAANLIDKVVFNVADSSTWVTFAADGTATNSFSFNKINNYGSTDQLGIFYGGNVTTSGAFQEITGTTPSPSYKLRDRIIYEDSLSSDDGLNLTNAYVNDESNIRANIQNIIQSGGTAGNVGGSDNLDFTYILYAQSSSDAAQTSAYVYAGTYGLTNKSAGATFDNTELKMVGLAEIVNVSNGVMNDNFLSSLPSDLS